MSVQKLKRAVIKEEYVAITGDMISAVLLNQFIYWIDKMKTVDAYIAQEKERAANNGYNAEMELSQGWIYKTAEELNDETMLGTTPNTIRKYINVLIEKGFLSVRTNPKYKWDKTKQYRVDLVAVARALKEHGYSLSEFKIDINDDTKNEFRNSKNESQCDEKLGAIPEITSETTPKTNKEIGDKPKRKRFVPPTREEVQAYCIERKNNVDAERFIDYYTSNGWRVGKNTMKDWKAAVRTWERNGFSTAKKVGKIYGANGIEIDPTKDDLDDIIK